MVDRNLFKGGIDIYKESKLNFLSYIIILDLVFGGAGRYFELYGISARMIIFSIALSLCIFKILVKKCFVNSRFYFTFFLFFLSIILSTAIGLFSNDKNSVFNGLSGFLYMFLIIFFIQNIETKEKAVKVFRFFNSMIVILSLVSVIFFILLLLFKSSFYSFINFFLIDKGFGFLDIQSNGMVRVFFKTSVLIPISCIYYLNEILKNDVYKLSSILYFIVSLLGLISTMTMTFWIVFVIGALINLLFFINKKKNLLLLILVIIMLLFVFDKIGYNITNIFTNRLDRNDPSLLLKQAQVPVLWDTFKQHIFFGNGFGKEVILDYYGTFREGSNWENMWLYLLVTNGLFGLVTYLLLIVSIIKNSIHSIKNANNENAIVLVTIGVGLVIECIISFSNPFLNNPIGIGFLCVSAGIVNQFINKSVKG